MKNKKNMKFWAMAVLLALLIVVSGVQTYELSALKEKIGTEMTILAAAKTTTVASSSSSSSGDAAANLKKNIANLPSMVGGC